LTIPFGSIVNGIAIIAGSLIGLLLHRSFPARIKDIVFQGIGLSILVIGIQMALSVSDVLALVFSVLIGAVIGEALGLEDRLERAGGWIKARLGSSDERFTQGMVTATLIFCVGSMAIVGAIDEGIRSDPSLLYTKSVLDGFTSVALASTYGVGVLFSFVPVLLYQGALTLLAYQAQGLFPTAAIAQLTATGGVLIIGLGLNLLEIKRIRVTNLLPCLLFAVVLALLNIP